MIGSLVLNRFEVEHRLGSGGFGIVYRAWDRRLERHVAVKAIEADGEAGLRVLREAQAAARLNHPGIVTLYELGSEDGVSFLVTELVEGGTLNELCKSGDLSDRDIAEIGADLCEALDHAHDRGIVHRDIKPQNVLVPGGTRSAKLMDFGIARIADAAGLTATGGVVGTLSYMSPEQAEGLEVGPETDVYSLALTIYVCLSGVNPHLRSSPAATARAIGGPVLSLSRHRPDLPEDLVWVIDAALEPDPHLRPSLEDLGETLELCLDDLSESPLSPAGSMSRRAAAFASNVEPVDIGIAATLAGLLAAAILSLGVPGTALALLAAPAVAALALLHARLGVTVAVTGLCAWLAGPAARPGTALILAAVTLPGILLVGGTGRLLLLPAIAPVLGAAGMATVFPLLAALAPRWRDRAVLSATGLAWLLGAEAVLGKDLLHLITAPTPDASWQESPATAITEVLVPLAADGQVWSVLAGWVLTSLVVGAIVGIARSRIPEREAGDRRAAAGLERPRPAPAGGRRAALP